MSSASRKGSWTASGAAPMAMAPAEFGKFLADETAKWAKVVKFSGASAD